MSTVEMDFKIIENYDCPLYTLGDEFIVSGNTLTLPSNKPTCLLLSKSINQFLEIILSFKINDSAYDNEEISFNCSGCKGLIRIQNNKNEAKKTGAGDKKQEAATDFIAKKLSKFSMFKTLGEHEIKDLVSLLKLKQFGKGEIIVKKGEPGKNLFIITSGRVEVLDEEGICITFLTKGDIFGEMSLLSGDPAGATVKVVEPAKVLSIDSKRFRKVMHKFPSLQMYLAKLLTQRLARANMERTTELSSVMSGTLSETSTSEVFQNCNINEKTGVLSLQLPDGTAELFFNTGKLVKAIYGDKNDKDAFFDLLKENEGRYKFVTGLSEEDMNAKEIGHFMCLLMDGVSKMDEEEFEKGGV